jgi:anti-sigma factor RsiW
MRSCTRYKNHLNAYMDNELSRMLEKKIRGHLLHCPACRAMLQEIQALDPLLQTLESPPLPETLGVQILSRARSLEKNRVLPKKMDWPGWRQWVFPSWLVTGTTTAALIAGLVLGSWMGWSGYRETGPKQFQTTAFKAELTATEFYAFDLLGAEPRGSIEAAALAMLTNGG